jgi:hypothetical protein
VLLSESTSLLGALLPSVGDISIVGGELADGPGALQELLGLGQSAHDRVLIAFTQS